MAVELQGEFNFDRTVEECFDVLIFNCPKCGIEHQVEPDADYMIGCDCGCFFRVQPVEFVI